MAEHRFDTAPEQPVPAAAPADTAEMIRSEERLRVGRQRVPVRVAKLQKFIVTEQRTITVEVRHEEVRVVYEDLPEGVAPAGGADARGGLPELVLHEEQIQVTRVAVPVERVRPVIETVTEYREVTGTLRAERIEVERTASGRPGDGIR